MLLIQVDVINQSLVEDSSNSTLKIHELRIHRATTT